MAPGLRRFLALSCAAVALYGAMALAGSKDPAAAYALLLGAAVGLVALGARPVLAAGERATWPRLTRALAAILAVAAVAIAGAHGYSVLASPTSITGPQQDLWWVAAAAAAVIAAHCYDRARNRHSERVLFDRWDWLACAALVAVAFATRVTNLAVDPPGLAYDEGIPLGRTLEEAAGMTQRRAFAVDEFALPGIFYHLGAFALTYAQWLGFDAVQTAKLPNVLFGAATVGILYATVRAFAARAIAAAAALFLTWLGWPWLLSRMYYLYSGDLFLVAVTTLLIVRGFASDRCSLLAAAGFTSAVAVGWFKSAVMLPAWALLMCADYLLCAPRYGGRRRVLVAAWAFTCLLSLAPVVAQFSMQHNFVHRFSVVAMRRAEALERAGLTSWQGYWHGTLGALTALQVREGPGGRHVVRLGLPALDPVTSALATVGAVWCLWHARRRRDARLALLGFAVFALPAVGSFPEDYGPAVTRRMIGSAFFVAWLAAGGAAVVAHLSTAVPFRRTTVLLTLGLAAMALNVYYVRTSYNTRLYHWHEEMGSNRVTIIHALRQAARVGPVFFRQTELTETYGTVRDLKRVHLVGTPAELRHALATQCGSLCTVILPWPSAVENNDTAAWIAELSDIIPAHAWNFGPPDPVGIPLYRRAEINRGPLAPR